MTIGQTPIFGKSMWMQSSLILGRGRVHRQAPRQARGPLRNQNNNENKQNTIIEYV